MSLKIDSIVTDLDFLRIPSRETDQAYVRDNRLIARLRKANAHAWTKGCGLSSVQIALPVRFAWCVDGGKPFLLLNPVIIEQKGEYINKEGCLSIPNRWFNIRRYSSIVYEADSTVMKHEGKRVTRKAFGKRAVMIQHEIDHMNGVLVLDKCVHQPRHAIGSRGSVLECATCGERIG